MKTCADCMSKTLTHDTITEEVNENGRTLVIPDVPVIKCQTCNAIYYSKQSLQIIDRHIAVFRANGFDNKADMIRKQKHITQEQLGQLLGGLTKQRVGQILKDPNPDVETMYRVSEAIQEPVQNVFEFNSIIEQDNKFYIDRGK